MVKLAISIGTLQTGGAEVFIINLLKNLDYRQFQVLLIVLDKKNGNYLEDEAEKLPIDIIYIGKKDGFRLFSLLRITRFLNRFKPDVLHGNIGGLLYFLGYLILNRKIKMVYTAHTSANQEFNKIKQRILRSFIRRNRIIPVGISEDVKASLYDIYRSENVRLIKNGIDIRKFQCIRNFQRFPYVIGHVGRFEEVKNHKTIVIVYKRLLRRYPNLHLKLIGEGSLFNKIREELKDCPFVTMIQGSKEVNKELQNIDIFFFPSYYEGMPLSLMEAMASGTVIIASRVGGITDLIEEGVNGYLIDNPEDVNAFVFAFDKLFNDRDNFIRISKNNRIKAEQFDVKRMAIQYQDLYKECRNRRNIC